LTSVKEKARRESAEFWKFRLVVLSRKVVFVGARYKHVGIQ
jgi:hypothetical protein